MLKFLKNLQLRVPRISFKDTPINVYLVYTIAIFAFLLGMLTNKVMYLEKVANTNAAPAAAADPAAPAAPPAVVENLDKGKLPLLGSKDAKVTIIEFSDFQCPFCKSYFDQTHAQIIKDYVQTGKVKFAFRHFPLTSIHPNAQKASEAAECANEQGNKFWAYHDLLFKNQDTWSTKAAADAAVDFATYAGQLGLDTAKFNSCLSSDKYKQNVDDDTAAGVAAQVDGTPTFFINGNRVVGALPYADFQKTIDEQLKK